MIKTHRPRGHHWTNASPLQQTETFRDIRLEECQAPSSRIYAVGTDERLPSEERAAKRRRIEKLADDFLNGKPLYISSARPCPAALRNTVAWNKKSSSEPKFVLQDVDRSRVSTELWEDVEDDSEVLKRATYGQKRHTRKEDAESYHVCKEERHDVAEQEEAQASCGRSRQTRASRLAAQPSEDALRKAAALRQRKLLQVQPETQSEPRPVGYVTDPAHDVSAKDEEGRPRIRKSEPEPREASVWLSRRVSHAFPSNVNEDSLDELRLSTMETPLRQLRKSDQTSTLSPKMQRMAIQHRISDLAGMRANDESVIVPETTTPYREVWPQEGSQSGLPRSQGTRIAHSTWTPINPPSGHLGPSSPRQAPSTSKSLPASPSTRRSARLSSKLAGSNRERKAYLDNAQTNITAHVSTRLENRAAADYVTPQQPSLHPVSISRQHLFDGPRVYTAEEGSKDGLTPFMFRKLRSGDLHGAREAAQAITAPQSSPPRRVTKRTPVGNEGNSNRCASEPPTSMQYAEVSPVADQDDVKKQSLSQFWPGTQVLLFQAQRDLFKSPEKQPAVDGTAISQPLDYAATPPAPPPSQEPLKQLSQEPLPSTQQLLDNFEGFSTVKKPRGAYRGSPAHTPTAIGRDVKTNKGADTSSNIVSTKSNRRSSSLRISMPSTNSPVKTVDRPSLRTDYTLHVHKATTMSTTELDTPATATRQRSMPRTSLEPLSLSESLPTNPLASQRNDALSQSFTLAPQFSSFQHAQRQSSTMSEGLLERTIDELTNDVLLMPEVEGVLSQG